MIRATCSHCGKRFQRNRVHVERTLRLSGGLVFCSRACSGARKRLPPQELKRRQSASQKRWRQANRDRVRANKRAYHLRTYDPDVARVRRAARLDEHRAYIAAYNADPKNKAKKRSYDLALRASAYGPFAESYLLLLDLQRLVRRLEPDKYERLKARGYYDRINAKKREQRRNDG